MSTGNNQGDTLISKKRKRKVAGYVHPNKPEIKKFDFFTGGAPFTGTYRLHDAREFLSTFEPHEPDADQVGCWTMVSMTDPSEGTTSYQRVGMKYFLKYMKIKGHIALSPKLPFTIHYKLLLIKSDSAYASRDAFFAMNFSNYEPLVSSSFSNIERFCRHNFYKTYKWPEGMSNNRTSVTVVSSGTLSPVDYIVKPSKASTLGQSPSYTYTQADFLRFGNSQAESDEVNQVCYLPLNVSVQVNDNVTVGNTKFWLMLVTDHGVGVKYPNYSSSTQYFYRTDNYATSTVARFNFFACCYFTDL